MKKKSFERLMSPRRQDSPSGEAKALAPRDVSPEKKPQKKLGLDWGALSSLYHSSFKKSE